MPSAEKYVHLTAVIHDVCDTEINGLLPFSS